MRRLKNTTGVSHPDVGLLGGRCPLAWFLLDEVAHRLDALVDVLVEAPVEDERRVEAHRAHRDPSGLVTGDGGGQDRRRRSIEGRRRHLCRCGEWRQKGTQGEARDANGE